jgi:hypothetical protein
VLTSAHWYGVLRVANSGGLWVGSEHPPPQHQTHPKGTGGCNRMQFPRSIPHCPAPKPEFSLQNTDFDVKKECRIGILVWPENAAKSSRGQSGYAFAAPMVIARHPPRSTTERQRKEGVGDSIADPPRDRIVGWVAAQPTGAGFERSASLQARDSMVLLRGPHPHPQPATCPVG